MQHYPNLRDLVRVIPVAQSQCRGNTTITLLSVDCYTDGWVANLRVHRDDSRFYPTFSFHPKYEARRKRQFGGVGSYFSWHHREDDPNWYLSYILYPALDPSEPDVEFIVRTVYWKDRTPPGWGVLMAEVPGPWGFTVHPSDGKRAETMDVTSGPQQPYDSEQREKRQQQTMPLYGPIYDEVLDILYRYDPMGIAWDNPRRGEEYNSEARTIVPRLSEARSAANVRQIVFEEFQKWFGASFRRTERLDELAAEIWHAWLSGKGEIQ